MQPNIILKRHVRGVRAADLARLAAQAARLLKLSGTLTVLVTHSREVRALNSRFRSADHATDVLSFPAPEFARGFAGDIVISADVASKNARTMGNTAAEEVKILVLHGMLHLAGYDHENDSGEMHAREQHLRKRLDLPVGLIERNVNRAGKATSTPSRKPARQRT